MENQNSSMKKEGEYGAFVCVIGHRCYRCKHAWIPRSDKDIPTTCPHCRSPYWQKQKTRFKKGEKKNGRNKV